MSRTLLAAAVMLAACGEPVGPSTDGAMVSLSREGTGDHLTVAITLENRGDVALTNNCQAIFLERATADGWVHVRGPSCVQPVPPPFVLLQPGESRTVTLDFAGPSGLYRPVAVVRLAGSATDRAVIGPVERW